MCYYRANPVIFVTDLVTVVDDAPVPHDLLKTSTENLVYRIQSPFRPFHIVPMAIRNHGYRSVTWIPWWKCR